MDITDELALFELHGECKRCSKCRELKPVSEFYRCKKAKSGYKHYCNACSHKSLKEWQENNREHISEYRKQRWRNDPEYRERHRKAQRDKYWEDPVRVRNDRLRYKYGITLEQYREMETVQSGGCAICGDKCKTGRDLAVDHNHKTGEVRALLCGHCNKGIGLFYDDPDRLMAAAAYLLSYQDVLKGASQ